MKSTLLVLYAETPLHAGSGVGLGAVDLPIQRERMSDLPMVQGSGIRGALRERMRPYKNSHPHSFQAGQEGRLDKDDFLALFGPYAPARKNEGEDSEADDAADKKDDGNQTTYKPDEFAGALSILDARVLLFPVRTAFGGFAWITCPLILDRLARDLKVLGMALPQGILDKLEPGGGKALVTEPSAVSRQNSLIIEDMDYPAVHHKAVDELATWLADHAFPQGDEYKPFHTRIKKQLAVVDDTEFTFLSKHATEVVARTRIDHQTGTVSGGALWTEENLPAETVLWSMAMFADSRKPRNKDDKNDKKVTSADLCGLFYEKSKELSRIHLGGDRGVGRGMVGLRVTHATDAGGDE